MSVVSAFLFKISLLQNHWTKFQPNLAQKHPCVNVFFSSKGAFTRSKWIYQVLHKASIGEGDSNFQR